MSEDEAPRHARFLHGVPRPSLSIGRTGSVLAVVLLLGAALSITSDNFLVTGNLLDVGRQSSLLALMAIGVTVVLISGQIDLSIAAIFTLAGLVSAMVISGGFGVAAGVACGLGVGIAAGLVNGVLSAYLRLPSFIVTLGTLQIFTGVSLLASNAENQALYGVTARGLDAFNYAGQGEPGGIPMQLIIMLSIGLIVTVMLRKSVFGMRLYATGGNRQAADLAGVPVRRVQITAFVISGVLAAMAGILALSFIGSISPIGARGQEFSVFAAAVIGGASLFGGFGTAAGAILGALLIGVLRNGLVLLGVSPFWQILTIGVVTIMAVALNRILQRGRAAEATVF